jgi:hypothetical protein
LPIVVCGAAVDALRQCRAERAREVAREPGAQADQRDRARKPHRLVDVEQLHPVVVDQDDAHDQR